MDTSELEAAYRTFLDTARSGGFAPPPDHEGWSAELVLAHVAATDRLLSATTAQVLSGRPARYDGTSADARPHLEAIARAAGDWDGLIAEVRRCGLELVLLTRQLDDAQAKTPVATRVSEADETLMEAPMPWSGVLATHAQVRLPGQRARLEALRS